MEKKAFRNTILLLGGIFIFIIIIVFIINLQNSYNLQSKAEGDPNPPGSPAWCTDHCNPSPETNPCNQNPTYKFPDCCNELANNGDPFACDWPDRGYCLDSQCASIPGGVVRQRCGGPKHSWCGECTTNNCPGYGSTTQPTSRPISTTVPTVTKETQPPQPTTIIRVPPNESPRPAITNSFQNSKPTSVTERFPNITINLVKINQNTRKPLDFFEYLFKRIIYYDNLLENTINVKLKNFITK